MPDRFWNIFNQTRALFKGIGSNTYNNHSLLGWNMYQGTRALYVKPISPPPPPPPPTLHWPRKIYVATLYSGVFYTENFEDPSTQPTWTAVNTGLPTLDCREFHLDPFDPEGRQYLMLETGAKLYQRQNGGDWTILSDDVSRGNLTGNYGINHFGGFYVDPLIQGRMWMIATDISAELWHDKEYAFFSEDYGATWNYYLIYESAYGETGTIRAKGNYAWSGDASGGGHAAWLLWTSDLNHSWRWQCVDLLSIPTVDVNPLKDFAYYSPVWTHQLGTFVDATNYRILQSGIEMKRPGAMWFSATNEHHQRLLYNSNLYCTNDSWASYTTAGAFPKTSFNVMAPWCGDDEDLMFISFDEDGYHAIAALDGEADVNPIGIAGENIFTPPYIGSIPYNHISGGVCWCGIQPVKEAGYVYI